ncbi:unknown [Coprobacillus sp. CAG:826]|nr:unknown [Coprobacillus sp. CAG:826]
METILSNTVSALGNYNDVPTAMASEAVLVTLLDGLKITKTADKPAWADGVLTYTIVLTNDETKPYTAPVVTDIIDNTLVDFISGSVMIEGVAATDDQYSYNENTHTLTVLLDDIAATSTRTITFQVKKKV